MSDWGLSHSSLFTLWQKHIPRPLTWNEKRTFTSDHLISCYVIDVWRAFIFKLSGWIFLCLRQQGLVLIDEHPIKGDNYTGLRTFEFVGIPRLHQKIILLAWKAWSGINTLFLSPAPAKWGNWLNLTTIHVSSVYHHWKITFISGSGTGSGSTGCLSSTADCATSTPRNFSIEV